MAPMNPRLLRPIASGRFAAIAKDSNGNVIQPVVYTEGGENYVAHIFNTSGTLQFLRAVDVEYLIVAGGGGAPGGGANNVGGGGGGGGVLQTGSPSAVAPGSYGVVIGAGGAAGDSGFATQATDGGNSSFGSFTAIGGGRGGLPFGTPNTGGSGGGGGAASGGVSGAAGTSGQGNSGGNGFGSATVTERASGGGGGFAGAGQNAALNTGGDGGGGVTSSISGTSTTYAAGGGGGSRAGSNGSGVAGVSGNGGGGTSAVNATSGTANRGGGGGGASNNATPGAGGSGIVIVRYRRAAPTLTLDPDALAYISAVQSADNAGLEIGVRDAINDFVIGCKADGIWDAIKASCILMGARTLSGALTPLKGGAPTNVNNNFVSGDYNRETGLVGNGTTKYLSANRNNNSDPQNSQHLALYASSLQAASVRYMGEFAASGSSTLGTAGGGTTLGVRSRNNTNVSAGLSIVNGFLGKSRNNSSTVDARIGGQTASLSSVSETPSTGTIEVFRASDFATTSRFAFYSIGESLDLALLDARVSALYTAIGAAI